MEKARMEFEQRRISAVQYSDAIAQLNEKLLEAKTTETAGIKDRIDKQGDWTNGAKLAFKQYIEDAQNTAAQTQQLFTDAFSALNNSLMNFVETGKLNFGDLTKKILEDLIMMEIKSQEMALFKAISGSASTGSFFSGIASLFTHANGGVFPGGTNAFAAGGVVSGPRFFAGGAGLMGEAGPEAIMPLKRGADGRLGVASQSGGSSSQVVQFGDFHFTINGDVQDKATAQAMQQQMIAQIATVVADQRVANSWRHNGISYNASRT
jgi:lambda family phage tail tape measure protein